MNGCPSGYYLQGTEPAEVIDDSTVTEEDTSTDTAGGDIDPDEFNAEVIGDDDVDDGTTDFPDGSTTTDTTDNGSTTDNAGADD